MAKLFSWDPWLELETMKEDMSRLVDNVACSSPFSRSAVKVARFRPVADVLEQDDAFVLLVELPGVELEDVVLEVHGAELVVYGERRFAFDSTKAAFHIMEGSYGCFGRQFVLPMDISASRVTASMRAGLLMVRVPKEPERPAKRTISVSVEE